MKRFFLVLGIMSLAPAASAQTLDIRLVKPFHVLERSLSLVAHHDQIVAGRTGTEAEGASFVESYDSTTYQLISSVSVKHSIRRLKVVDSCKLLAMSTEAFSVINYCTSGAPTAVTRATPAGMIAHEGAALSASEFVFIEPNEGLVRVNLSGREQRLGDNISYTRSMDFWHGSLWVANYFNIWRVDPVSGDRVRVLKTDNEIYGLKYTIPFEPEGSEPMIVASARDDKKLLFVSALSGKPLSEFDIKGEPAGMAAFGQCLVTVLSDTKQVYFLKMVAGAPQVISTWDALPAGDMLKQPTEIAVSEEMQTVFLRSSYPCPTCTNTQSAIYSLTEPAGTTFSQCL